MKRLHIDTWLDDVYHVPMMLCIGPFDLMSKWVQKRYDIRPEPRNDDAGACTLYVQTTDGYDKILFWFPSYPRRLDVEGIGMIAHEALHATFFVLLARGLVVTQQEHETFTYYHSWVLRQLLKRLR